ncbi:MAG: hypothetical protein IT557_14485 [Alphaproteobacteria bacterium]|nr:hypothetical protein [Alphaproteobacteria bacterium]
MPLQALEPDDYHFLDYRRFTFSLAIVAGGASWIAGSTAARFDAAQKGVVVEGDLVAQARTVYEKMRITLKAGGQGLGDVVRLVEYLTPAALPDRARLDALRRELFAGNPVVTTIVVRSLLRPTALIEVEGVAARGGEKPLDYVAGAAGADAAAAWVAADAALRERGLARADVIRATEFLAPGIAPGTAQHAGLGTRHVMQIVGPRVASDGAGAQVELVLRRKGGPRVVIAAAQGDPAAGDVVGQCREIYQRIGAELAAAGAGLDRVVKTTEFIPPAALAAYRGTADVRRDCFKPPYPAATGVICEGYPTRGVQIAVEAIAVLD